MDTKLLNPEQQAILEKIAEQAPERIRKRARLLLLYNEGHPTRQVSQQTGISSGRARFWKRQFKQHAMSIFPRVDYQREILEKEEEPVAILPVEPELPFPSPRKAPGITPDDTMAEAGRKILGYHFALMLSHESGTRLGKDIEELHDMRVATRRMRAAFVVFGEAYQVKVVKPILKGLRKIGRSLGQVRDIDVFIEKAMIYRRNLPSAERAGLDPLLHSWNDDLAQSRSILLAHLDSNNYVEFKKRLNQFVQKPGQGTELARIDGFAGQLVRHVVPILVYARFAGVMSFDQRILNATIPELHALRIEFKQLRYTLEFFQEVLSQEATVIINEIKTMQDHLGELNDAQVACGMLKTFLEEFEASQTGISLKERADLTSIVRYLADRYSERHRLVVTFQDRWEFFKRPELRQMLALAVAAL